MGALNAGGVGKNCTSRPVSGFWLDDCWTVECCQHFKGGVRSGTCLS